MTRTAYAVIHLKSIRHNVQQVRLAAPNSAIIALEDLIPIKFPNACKFQRL